jgi:SecD/SecF fusion protein
MVVRGLDLGVEFTGGRLLEYSATQPVTSTGRGGGAPTPGSRRPSSRPPTTGTRRTNVSVRDRGLTNDEAVGIEQALDRVGRRRHEGARRADRPRSARSCGTKALIALGVAPRRAAALPRDPVPLDLGLAAVLAMFHDVVVVVGLFAWLGRSIDGSSWPPR